MDSRHADLPRPSWFARHPRLVDAAVTFGLWFFGGATTIIGGTSTTGIATVALIALAQVQVLSQWWRRSHPVLAFVVFTAACLAQVAIYDSVIPANLAAPFAAYAAARYIQPVGWRWASLAVSAASGLIASVRWSMAPDGEIFIPSIVVAAFLLSGVNLIAWLGGELARRRAQLIDGLAEQNAALRRDRDQRARIAAADERTRIAREMHDVVAHSLSVVVVQADGAAYAAEHAGTWKREQAAQALTTIGSTAREALAETRRLVGVLRETGQAEGGDGALTPIYAPTEALSDLPALVERLHDSGRDITLTMPDDLTEVPRETGLAAYRIVQESLTNVIKHAGPYASAAVVVTRGPADLDVRVTDTGRGATTDDGDGHGLIGMRERAQSVGGEVSAGPDEVHGGWRVHALLPLRSRSQT